MRNEQSFSFARAFCHAGGEGACALESVEHRANCCACAHCVAADLPLCFADGHPPASRLEHDVLLLTGHARSGRVAGMYVCGREDAGLGVVGQC